MVAAAPSPHLADALAGHLEALYGDTYGVMATEHRALIHWTAAQIRRGLPDATQLIDQAWLDGRVDEACSLVCRFAAPPVEPGSPSSALVHFIMPDVPHGALRPGETLELFERGTSAKARVEILD